MENLADQPSSTPVSCKHCAALLQEGDRFCRFCGTDQTIQTASVRTAGAKPARGRALAPIQVDFADTVQPEEETVGSLVVTRATNDETNPEIGQVRPGAVWQQEATGGRGSRHWASNSVVSIRLVIAIMATLAVLVVALMFDHFYLDKESDAGRQREFKANVARVQSALSRGDLAAAERVLDALDVDHADDPGVLELRESFDQRLQAQAARRDQLRNAAVKASSALGMAESSAPATPTAPEAPRSAIPAPANSVADPKEKECNEALAALALCQK
ncbi:zinc ribbon domain-containing protein [Variovorax flavidus]|uniref:zinc ribbon domain-containing protein n=1 Tax=Variovorax flavidus TaxID=3053501 RepID=UPI002578966C|nr:zinc ribbon domain-containing protein [Variovorax sp. J2P1-59]